MTDNDIRKSIDRLWSYDNIAYLVEGGDTHHDESKHNLTMEIVGTLSGFDPNKCMRVLFSISFSDDFRYTNSDMIILYKMFVRCKECCGSDVITKGEIDLNYWGLLYLQSKMVLNKHYEDIKDMLPWSGPTSFSVDAIRCY
jgi:hypothetical protein